jgi:glycosyltransferase involved in cell wall biosynthesis/GT2 family glycosyltransferase
MAASVPSVSVLLAVHNDERYIRLAVESVLRQTFADLELIVIDDGSTDETAALLAEVGDPRLVVVRNERQLGLAKSLNRGLELARGRYVARLDADDVALPTRLELQLEHIRRDEDVAIVGTGVLDLDEDGDVGALHRMPRGKEAVRWESLFTAPVIHPTALIERRVLERHGLRYDPAYLESEDYDLFTRLLGVSEGDNLAAPLVLKRAHAGQASKRRSDLQTGFQRKIALREIRRLAPDLSAEDAERGWRFGSGRSLDPGPVDRDADSFVELLRRFESHFGVHATVRESAARTLARQGLRGRALRLSPSLPARVAAGRSRRTIRGRPARRRAASWLRTLEQPAAPLRVTVVSPEPTPYRAPLFDLVSDRSEVELTVVYAAESIAGRTWTVQRRHQSRFLRGVSLPGVQRVVHHDYPVTPGIVRALRESRPDVVVVSGWSTFASQAAIAWCRTHSVPYLLLVESHDLGPRAGWRRAVKGAVVPRLLRHSAGALALGTASRVSLIERGLPAERIRVFANTIDVGAWAERADRLAQRRSELRAGLGAAEEDVVVLSVARLGLEKGLDTLVRAIGEAGDPRLRLVLVGDGPERGTVEDLARELGVRIHLTGDLPGESVARMYAAADVFALLSSRETWGVVVNEAAASGLPLVLSDRVGAAHDLLRDGENGYVVPAGDVAAAAAAFRRFAGDADLRRTAGARSRELIRDWGYEPSVESFVAAVREAAAR